MNSTTNRAATCTPRTPACRFSCPMDGPITDCSMIVIGAASEPELINSDPYGKGWVAKIKLAGEPDLSGLMDAEAYKAYNADR